ncbi:glycosyl transferase [Helicobacter didelphidarum]|uniref:Glycosyl transferase n=1 Tax=Helicobacter didelphidarum TaxID=2040648 RepID=A0A3D8ILZ5_9HELI|nr:glycosyltransferase family 8 protein [Helicobacter didelphidarum]RDU66249.1 glycosyl transferase [Helicobacter didelphidarum]
MFHIAFNCDENYIKYVAVLITNIIKYTDTSKNFTSFQSSAMVNIQYTDYASEVFSHNESKSHAKELFDKDELYHFHILIDTITFQSQEQLQILQTHLSKIYPCKIEIHIINNDEFAHLEKWGFETQNHAAWYRLLLNRFLPKDVTKVLYLDTDMLVLCDVRELFAIDLGNAILASSSGDIKILPWRRKFKAINTKKSNKVVSFKNYFCSGLMFINMVQWREKNIESKCLKFLQEYKSKFADQDPLNFVAQDSLALTSNWGIFIYQYILAPDTAKMQYKEIFDNIKIIHCNGYAKPWSNFFVLADKDTRHLVFDTWWEIALSMPIFQEELQKLRNNLKESELYDAIGLLRKQMAELEKQINKPLYKIIGKFFRKIFRT